MLDMLLSEFENVVKYDAAGNPAYYVKFPKMKSSELDASLPDHTHPAFIINGEEQDYILIGKYGACEVAPESSLYSIPNGIPAHGKIDAGLTKMRAAHPGASGLTAADAGFLLLLAQKLGWACKGNTGHGAHYADATEWAADASVSVDDVRAYKGWTYKCLSAHTTSDALAPNIAPGYWRKMKHIGGVSPEGSYTLTGTGPVEWYLGNDVGSIADIVGNVKPWTYGVRIKNAEINIVPDNDAALPTADLSANSSLWKAIKPHADDDGYDLVAPGTSGTLHYDYASSVLRLDTSNASTNTSATVRFKNMTANTTNLPYIPCIMRELGLFPTSGSTMPGIFSANLDANEHLLNRGGHFVTSNTNYGLGSVLGTYSRSSNYVSVGYRSRCIDTGNSSLLGSFVLGSSQLG